MSKKSLVPMFVAILMIASLIAGCVKWIRKFGHKKRQK